MGQLPEFHDSDDDELIALGGALDHPNTKDGERDRMEEEEFFKQLKAVDRDQAVNSGDSQGYDDQM